MINSKSAWDQLQNTPKNVPNILAAHRVGYNQPTISHTLQPYRGEQEIRPCLEMVEF